MRVPAELTDRIIDFLHWDRAALAACSLVCKTWLPSSRYHDWEEVSISFNNVSGFIELLEAPTSTIAKYILTLHIAFYGDKYYKKKSMFPRLRPCWDKLLNLKSLILSCGFYKEIQVGKEHDDDGCLSRSFARITQLDLDIETLNLRQLLDTIANFLSLETLVVNFYAARSDSLKDDRLIPFYFPPHLRHIRFILDQRQAMLPWLISVAQFPPIGRLDLACISEGELSSVRHLLRSLGPSIHTLLLHFHFPDMGKICNCIDLTMNTHLRWLCISGIPLKAKDGQATAEEHRCLPDVLSQVTSLHLSRLELVASTYSMPHLHADCVDWKLLSQVLDQPQFTQLESVHIIFPSEMPTMTDRLHDQMSSVANRGILDVSHSDASDYILDILWEVPFP